MCARIKPPFPPKPKGSKSASKPVDMTPAIEGRRVKNVEAARTIYNRFVTDDSLRSATIAQVRNQLEGGRPRDPAQMEANGEGWSCNVNFGDAEASRDRTLLPYWRMIHDVPRKAVFTIDTKSPQTEVWQEAYAECFDEFLADWGADYFCQYMDFASNFVNYGPGIVQWGDMDSARWNAVNVQRIYWPKNTKMSPKGWEVMALVRDMSASELYKLIRDKKTAKQSAYAGWNENAVKAAIVQAKDGGPTPDYRDYTVISDQLVNNDIAVTTPFSPIPTVWLYVKNFDGKIGCYVFTVNQGVDDFLFEDDSATDDFRQLLGAVWYSTGTSQMIHSIKGFGIKNYFFSALQNRMKSRIIDGGTFAMGVNFQYQDANNPDETPPVENYGAFTVFPSGLTQLTTYPNLQAAQAIISMLDNNANENNSLYKPQNQQIESADTATQAKILAAMQGQLSEASASIYTAQVGENIFTEQVRRLRRKGNRDEDAVKFVRRLRDRGVPDEVIFVTPLRVQTGANAGMANPALRAQSYQEGLQLANYPGMNRRWFLTNIIANKYGANAVSKAMLPEGQYSEPIQRRQAQMENVDFGQGVDLQVAPEDAHYEHVQEHLAPLTMIEQGFKQIGKVSPEQAAALVIGLEHTGKHMEYLQADTTQKIQFQEVLPQFRLIQSVARGILTRMKAQRSGPQAITASQPTG
jgi:hypothetical protein